MLSKIANMLKTAKSVSIITHENPDGDAYGSSFGLKYALESIGVKAQVVMNSPVDRKFMFMNYAPVSIQNAVKTEAAVCVDFGILSRGGECAEMFETAEKKAVLDHHITDEKICEYHYSDTSAAAACEIVLKLILEMGISLNKKIAEPIYIGIMTDSGCCRYSNTTKNTLNSLAALIDFVDVAFVNHMVFDVMSKEEFYLKNKLLSGMKEGKNGAIHYLSVKKEYSKDEALLNGLSNDALNIEGTKIGILFKEREDKVIKVSVRSAADINVAELCGIFGGGGHVNAAGCTIYDTLEKAVSDFLSEAEKMV